MCSNNSLEDCLKTAEKMTAEAEAGGARLIALPEYFFNMGNPAHFAAFAEDPGTGPIQDRLALLAARLKIFLLAGSLPIRAPSGRMTSSSVLFSSDGKAIAQYDKRHLFDQTIPTERHCESDFFEAGTKIVTAKLSDRFGETTLGLSICYDLRFPEHYRALAAAGAEILCVPSAFTKTTGEAHWHILLRARAIENQCYVLAPGQVGSHGSKKTYGHSMIVGPWGEIIAEADGESPCTLIADLDLDRLRELRESFPVLRHRL